MFLGKKQFTCQSNIDNINTTTPFSNQLYIYMKKTSCKKITNTSNDV